MLTLGRVARVAATLAVLLGTPGCGGLSGSPPEAQRRAPVDVPDSATPAVVVRVVDGDTVMLRSETDDGLLPPGDEVRARLLEIDSPEVEGPYESEECFGAEASAYLTELIPAGETVWIERDRELRDQYDRYLLYVWAAPEGAEPVLVNEQMIATGHARAVLYEPNDRYIDIMRDAEQRARQAHRGMWGRCGG